MATISNLLVDQFFRTTLAQTASVGATSLSLADSSKLPEPTGAQYFYITLVSGNSAEVAKVTNNNVATNTLTLDTGLAALFVAGSRAELWFTAQAFQDIQAYLEGLAEVSYPGVDESTISAGGGTLGVKALGIEDTHIANLAIFSRHMNANSVGEDSIQSGAVTNAKIDSVAGSKITGALPTPSITEAVERSNPADSATAALDFSHIAYVEQPFDSGDPSGGAEGSIVIEFES